MLLLADKWKDYELIDMGNGEKLERWGDIVLRTKVDFGKILMVITTEVQKVADTGKLKRNTHKNGQ